MVEKILIYIAMLLLGGAECSAQTGKMSLYVREAYKAQASAERETIKSKSPVNNGTGYLTALVKANNVETLRNCGCKVLRSIGNIHITAIPLDKLGSLAAMEDVERIEAGEPCHTSNDIAAMMTKVDKAWSYQATPPTPQPTTHQAGFTGEGVVVGVMDIGFDLTHPTFLSADGTRYRIGALWDMLDYTAGGEAVTGTDTIYVGRQYRTEDELTAKGGSADRELTGHGTHTAATASGSGRFTDGSVSQYKGMAPDATLCLVSNCTTTDKPLIPTKDHYKYNKALDVLGFAYIMDYAKKEGKPCVISFSEGASPNLDNENLLYTEALKALQGPGRIIVASAGNEGEKNTYLRKPAGTSMAGGFVKAKGNRSYHIVSSDRKIAMRITLYPQGMEPIARTVTNTDIMLCKDSIWTDTIRIGDKAYTINISVWPSAYDESKWVTETLIESSDKEERLGNEMPISVAVTGKEADVELYSAIGELVKDDRDDTLCGAENTHNILTPGCLDGIICAGSVAKKPEAPTISTTSGRGPSLTGTNKPDVVAPGEKVISAWSHYTSASGTCDWIQMTGTSMSTPCVAGIIALWLQACPQLTTAQALETIARTATHPDSALDYPNNEYGYGMIDAVAGLRYILEKFTDIRDVKAHAALQKIYDLQGRRTRKPLWGEPYKVTH